MKNIAAGIFSTVLVFSSVNSYDDVPCDVRAWTEAGWVCGLRRWSEYGKVYASFRGVPYAKQPVGELRFKELQPLEPWDHDFDARGEGPVCIQHDEIYGDFTTLEYGMSEACIHANIHVPLYALPKYDKNKKKLDDKFEKNQKASQLNDGFKKIEKDSENKVLDDEKKNKVDSDKEKLPKESSKDNKDSKIYIFNENKYVDKDLNSKNKRDQAVISEEKAGQEELNYKFNLIGNQDPMIYSSLVPLQRKEGDIYDLSKYEEQYNKNMEDIVTWLNRINKNEDVKNYDKSKPKEGNEDISPVFWPTPESPLAGGKTQHIFETWPKFQKHSYKKEEATYPLSRPVKRYVDNDEGDKKSEIEKKLLPILVMIHGGGFNAGSGDADLYGPEYLVSKDVIVITFNYRFGLFGFLYLNTPSVPGNAGLRDQITLLRWVQRNAKHFGGDPEDVTLMGHSSGAACAHLLSLSEAAKGLFKRVILQSGTAYQGFYTTSPIYSTTVTASFLAIAGIVAVDPETIHQELIKLPIKRIIEANVLIQAQYGAVTFTPVVETRFPGVTTVIDKDPETLIAEGRGKEYPFIIGCTTVEAETFRRRLGYERYVSRIVANPRMILPVGITFSTLPNVSLALGKKVKNRCFHDKPDLDGVVRCYGEAGFIYQAFRLARQRAQMDSAPTFMYQFSYESDFNLVQNALKLSYKGTAHIEDLNYVFRANSLLEPKSDFPQKDRDDMMRDWMSSFIVNFIYCSDPTCNKHDGKSGWPKVTKDHFLYEDIETPYVYSVRKPSKVNEVHDIITFYDDIYRMSGVAAVNGTQLLK